MTLGTKLIMSAVIARGNYAQAEGVVQKALDVGPAWSVHQTGQPQLYTRGGYQYVLYYDADRMLRLAQRQLGSEEWREHVFPVQAGWSTGGHAAIALAVDADGDVHVAPYRRRLAKQPSGRPASIYYRTRRPHDLDSFARMPMVNAREPNPHYPTFAEAPDGSLAFLFRQGGAASGNRLIYNYDVQNKTWLNEPGLLLSGTQHKRSPYVSYKMGPDGYAHMAYLWRDGTLPGHFTGNTLSYIRSRDLKTWETVSGEKLHPPLTFETEGVVVDPVPRQSGLINMSWGIGFDSRKKPVIFYHKYDKQGNSQIYNARFDNGEWNIVAASDWDYRWVLGSSKPIELYAGAVEPAGDGTLRQRFWHTKYGEGTFVLDEETLKPIKVSAGNEGAKDEKGSNPWPAELDEPESNFTARPMNVSWRNDNGSAPEEDVRYYLRWEHGPRNSDRPVGKPWPEPSMLRVYKFNISQ